MKNLFRILLCLCVTSVVMCFSCDEANDNVKINKTKFDVGTANWSSEVTSAQKEIITEMINNMVCVDATQFYMGVQSKNSKRANYSSLYSDKDTVWDASIAHLLDSVKVNKVYTMYSLIYYNNGLKVGPVIEVSMPSYYIGKYEITQAQWNAVMDRKPTGTYCKVPEKKGTDCWYEETGKGDNIAAYNISYDDAVEFCQTLSRKTGLKFRLPTEAEWECAARGGAATRGYKYSGADLTTDVAWTYSNACKQGIGNDDYGVHAGGELDPNELGIYDMSGNVSEWVANSYYQYHYLDSINPQGKMGGDTLILRGGSWTQSKTNEFCPGNRRKFIKSSYSSESFLDAIAFCGFRIVISK